MFQITGEEHLEVRETVLRLKAENNAVMNKRLRKLIEDFIVEYEVEYTKIFGVDTYKKIKKNKSKISEEAISDQSLQRLLADETLDCIEAYLLRTLKDALIDTEE